MSLVEKTLTQYIELKWTVILRAGNLQKTVPEKYKMNNKVIFLDNNSLSDICNDSKVLKEAIHKIKKDHLRISTSLSVIDEFLSGSRPDFIQNRAINLLKLERALGPHQLSLFQKRDLVITKELQKHRPLPLPIIPSKIRRKIFGFLDKKTKGNFEEITGKIHQHTKSEKEIAKLRDKEAQCYISPKISEKELIEVLKIVSSENFSLCKLNEHNLVIPWLWEGLEKLITGKKKLPTLEHFLAQPNYYPTCTIWLSLYSLTVIGSGLPNSASDYGSKDLIPSWGDWTDLSIAASAAYADFFVSKDSSLSNKYDRLDFTPYKIVKSLFKV